MSMMTSLIVLSIVILHSNALATPNKAMVSKFMQLVKLRQADIKICRSLEIHETSCTFDLLRHIDPPSLDSFIHYAQSKIPSHIKIDLNNTDILKQVIKEKDQLVSFLEQHGDLSFNS
jgi:hypothetical protein